MKRTGGLLLALLGVLGLAMLSKGQSTSMSAPATGSPSFPGFGGGKSGGGGAGGSWGYPDIEDFPTVTNGTVDPLLERTRIAMAQQATPEGIDPWGYYTPAQRAEVERDIATYRAKFGL